jgi:hypothetical protein
MHEISKHPTLFFFSCDDPAPRACPRVWLRASVPSGAGASQPGDAHARPCRTDLHERYEPFGADFGPVNLGVLHQFCQMMQDRMSDERLSHRHLVYYADDSAEVRTNAALLLAAYMV